MAVRQSRNTVAKLASYLSASSNIIGPSQGVVRAHSYSPRALTGWEERKARSVRGSMFKPSDRLMQDFSDYQTRSKQGEYSCDFLDGTPPDACNKTPHNQEKAWASCCVQEPSGGGSWMVTLPSYLFPVQLGAG